MPWDERPEQWKRDWAPHLLRLKPVLCSGSQRARRRSPARIGAQRLER
jgi:hypothetical protein